MLHCLYLQKNRLIGFIVPIFALFLLYPQYGKAQTDTLAPPRYQEHLLGVRGTFSLAGVHFNPDRKQTTTPTYKNASLLYTYYHGMWGKMPFFGFQTGVTYCQTGYRIADTRTLYDVIQVPLSTQFHFDFWKMRLLVNLGFFGGYRWRATEYKDGSTTGTPVVFDCNHRYIDYGLAGGGGLALHFHPIEIQLECNYQYSLSLIENPAKYSNETFTYGYPNQLMISLGIFIHL